MNQSDKRAPVFGKSNAATAALTAEANGARRGAARKSTRCLAYLVAPGSRKELECLVVDMSASGAKLKLVGAVSNPFAAPIEFPKEFRLILPADKIEVECHTCWSKGATCGVTFASPFRSTRS